jgi:protein involved in polysaccharide export with SLBB domain
MEKEFLAPTDPGDGMKRFIENFPSSIATLARRGVVSVALVVLTVSPTILAGQSTQAVLTSRSDLTAAAVQAESGTSANGNGTRNAMLAAAIRQRLQNGDFQVGDRIILSYTSDVRHADTLIVRSGPSLELPAKATLPLSGILRSELSDRVTTELLKYVKATQIEVTPLTRVGVLGEVVRPGYFALRSDVPLAEAIMIAGGPTATADVDRSMVRRSNGEFKSAEETRQAIAKGLTIDQFGLAAGDELVIGRRRDFVSGSMMPLVGALASITAIFVAVHH